MQMGYRSGAGGEKVAAKRPGFRPRDNCCAALLLLAGVLCPAAQAMQAGCPGRAGHATGGSWPGGDEAGGCAGSARGRPPRGATPPPIVIRFIGGRANGSNLVHRAATLAKEL